jgi:hypothetical protein
MPIHAPHQGQKQPAPHARTPLALALLACILAGCITGCVKGKVARQVTLEEFRTQQNAQSHPGDIPGVDTEAVRLDPDLGFAPEHGERGVMDIAVFPGRPQGSNDQNAQPGAPAPLGDSTVVDIKVGEVIGDAIFASEFFGDLIAERLTTEAEQMSERAWAAAAMNRIEEELMARIQQTLVVEKARSRLTPEQRQGLIFFLDQIQRDLLSRNRGSESLLARTLEEERGKTLQEVRDEEETAILFREELRRIRRGVQISSADVKREYDLNYGAYNYGRITLRTIRVRADDQDAVDLVTQQLASGETFETVAQLEVNSFRRSEGGLWERQYRGDRENAAIYGDDPADPRNVALRGIQPGQTVGPVEAGSSVYWLHCVDRVHTSFSLAQAQRHIENKLYTSRSKEALKRYVNDLLAESSITRIEDMQRRLFDYAYHRFYIPAAKKKEEEARAKAEAAAKARQEREQAANQTEPETEPAKPNTGDDPPSPR